MTRSARSRLFGGGALVVTVVALGVGAQYLAHVLPLTYYLRIVRGIILTGVARDVLWPNLLPLIAFGTIVFTLSVLRFRKPWD